MVSTMNQIRKHTFEAVSLLTADNGLLDVSIIPAVNQPDWLIPTNLILSIEPYSERIWTYLWHDQEVAVFHLLPRDDTPDKVVILEGNTDVHRLALQLRGEIQNIQVRISDVKDIELPEKYLTMAKTNIDVNKKRDEGFNFFTATVTDQDSQKVEERFRENVVVSYLFQTVMINDQPYLVPDLDKIAHQLVDLDS